MKRLNKNTVLIDKKSIFIDKSVKIGKNVTIYENNRIEKNTIIGDNCVILPNNHIIDTVIGENSTISSSHCQEAFIGNNCQIGPFSRLRPNAKIMDGAHIGNFVEVKNATIGENTKACHLAYIGDAEIGKNCNIGCGAIFVNYNGKTKNKTTVGDNCFIGSNCNVIAPVKIESNSYITAGTTVTDTVHSDDFVIGRCRQQVKPNRAHKYLKNTEYKE